MLSPASEDDVITNQLVSCEVNQLREGEGPQQRNTRSRDVNTHTPDAVEPTSHSPGATALATALPRLRLGNRLPVVLPAWLCFAHYFCLRQAFA